MSLASAACFPTQKINNEKLTENRITSTTMRPQPRPRQQSTSALNNREQRMHSQIRHLMHNNAGSKINRSRTNHTSDSSLSVGYVRDLEQCQEAELIDIRKKNLHILENPYVYMHRYFCNIIMLRIGILTHGKIFTEPL